MALGEASGEVKQAPGARANSMGARPTSACAGSGVSPAQATVMFADREKLRNLEDSEISLIPSHEVPVLALTDQNTQPQDSNR